MSINSRFETIVEILRNRAVKQAQQRAYTFLVDGKVEGTTFTYAQLDRQARAIGALLQQHQARGARVMLLYPQGLEVIAAFLGCLYGGAIAIPVPAPESGRLKRTLPRLQAIAKDAQATFVLTTAAILDLVKDYRGQIPEFADGAVDRSSSKSGTWRGVLGRYRGGRTAGYRAGSRSTHKVKSARMR